MKHTIKKYTFITILCVVISIISCKKLLDPTVIAIPIAENAYLKGSDIDKGLAGAYSLLRIALPDKLFLFSDMRSYNFSSYSFGSNVRPETQIPRNTGTPLINNGGGNWSQFYTVIAQCNLVLEKISTIASYDTELRKKHIGEAKFIRALTYFYLVRFWGDVPINLEGINVNPLRRSPRIEVFKLINSDLDDAISNLSIDYGADTKAIRATKGAAWAIKAHVAAWLHDYSAAAALCDSVIVKGNYSLITDTSALLKIFVGKSIEGIFELNFDYGQKELARCKMFTRTTGRPWYTDVSDGGGGRDDLILSPTKAQKETMFPPDRKDARRFTWFVKDKYDVTSVFFGKYRSLAPSADTTSQNINESNVIITRLADIYLLQAEALAELNRNAEATNALNIVRKRAFASQYVLGTGNIKDTILLERQKELIGEGHFFFDLVRTRQMPKYSLITQADWYEKEAWLLPINQAIIAESGFIIEQNDFWK